MVSRAEHVGLPLQLAPTEFAAELATWLSVRRLPDDLLLVAILENNLQDSAGHSKEDDGSWSAVRACVGWLLEFAPMDTYGSAETVRRWQSGRAN